jgi:hypothetical protein
MRSPVVDLLADAAGALHEAGVPWYLFGAQAAILYGAARLTADVDVTVRLPSAVSAAGLVDVFRRHGFDPRFDTPTFIERTRVMPLIHHRSSIPLDVVLGGPGLEDVFLERALTRDLDGVAIPVASAEDLIVMKILAGRDKDLDDVRSVIAAQGSTLDAGYVRDTLRSLEAALGQADLVPTFELALRRASSFRRGNE